MENEFDRIVRDAKFAFDLMEQNREMEHFVNESLILASGNKQAINEMVIIHEAAAGDKISGFFEKIKNFFKKIFDKLGASMSALFKEQKEYIDKYDNIISKCKWNVGDASDLYDIFQGVPRIISAVDAGENAIFGKNMDKYFNGTPNNDQFIDTNTFASKENISKKLAELKANPIDPTKQKAVAFDEFTNEGYWSGLSDFKSYIQKDGNGNTNPSETFKFWFQGSVDTKVFSGDEMDANLQTCINVCYAGQSYINKLEKIVTTVNKKMEAAQKAMEDYHKAQKEKILAYAKTETGNKETHEVQAKKGSGDGKFTVEPGAIEDAWLNDANNKPDANEIKDKSIADIESYLNSMCKVTIKVKAPADEQNNNQQQNNNNALPKWADIESSIPTPVEDISTHKWKVSYDGVDITDGNNSDDAKDKLKKALKNAKKISESFNMYRDFRNYFNEANFGGSNGSSSSGSSNTGAGSSEVQKAGELNTKLSNTTTNDMKANDNITVQGGTAKEAEEVLSLDITRRETCINADVSISTTIATAMFNAFKYINKESFSAIKAHVQWYLSNPGAENDSANQTPRVRKKDMNAAQAPVTSTATNNTQ